MIACALLLSVSPCSARKYKMRKKGPPVAQEVLDPQAQFLIGQLSRHPELMNLEYLKYFIGRPENESKEASSLTRRYYWYDQDHVLRYELDQIHAYPGAVVDSTMMIRLDDMGLTFEKLQPIYGLAAKRFFDYQGHPSVVYMSAPNTLLSFSSPANTFRLDQAKIVYRGEPLPAPAMDDMAQAESQLLARAGQTFNGGDAALTGESVTVLQARVKTKPFDAEGHLMLAQALQKQSQLNEAICEYKLALAMSGTNDNVRVQSLNSLRALHIIDDQTYIAPRRDLKLIQKGQRLRVAGVQSNAAENQDNEDNNQ